MTIKRVTLTILALSVVGLITVAALGYYKFNILGDDLYFDGKSATDSNITGSWQILNDPIDTRMHFYADGSWRSVDKAKTEYGTWTLADGGIVFEASGENGQDRALLKILSWNDKRLSLQTWRDDPITLVRLETESANLQESNLDCPAGTDLHVKLAFADWVVPGGDITGMKTSSDTGNNQILLTLSESAALQLQTTTKAHLGKPLPVTINDVVVAAPVVREPITGGSILVNVRTATVPSINAISEGPCLGKGLPN